MGTTTIRLTEEAIVNIETKRGNSIDMFEIPLKWEDGSSIDLSNYTSGIMSVKTSEKSSVDIITFSTTDGSLIIGTSKVTLDKDASEMLVNAGTYVYDIALYDNSDNRKTFVKGEFTVLQNVS